MDRLLLPALAAHPEDWFLRFLSGSMNFELLNDEAAIEDLETVLRQHQGHFNAALLLGRAYHRQGDLPSALSTLDAALDLEPEEDAALRRLLGLVLADAGYTDRAIQCLDLYLLDNPDDTEVQETLKRLRAGG